MAALPASKQRQSVVDLMSSSSSSSSDDERGDATADAAKLKEPLQQVRPVSLATKDETCALPQAEIDAAKRDGGAGPDAIGESGSRSNETDFAIGEEGEDGEESLGDDEGEELDEETINDIIEGMMGEDEKNGTDRTPMRDEIINFLHERGPHEFVEKYIESEAYTPVQLCEAFGLPMQEIGGAVSDIEDFALGLLGKLIERELRRRRKLPQYNTLDDAVRLLSTSKRILVLTGAGISTSLGIPDFRSADGLYAQLARSGMADRVDEPSDVFALSVFKEDPTIFYSVAQSILSSDKRFSPTHAFIRLLQDQGKLQTNFTQNIDNLEEPAGIHSSRLVHCHGSFATATCQKCRTQVHGDTIHDEIRAGKVPRCKRCIKDLASLRAPPGMKRKRSSNSSNPGTKQPRKSAGSNSNKWDSDANDTSDSDSIPEPGVMKPDITFFGEDLPDAFHKRAMDDKLVVDLVIVIGTSLKVAPVSEIPNFIPPNVPQIYISRDPCRHIDFDVELLGESDVICAELAKRAGWSLRHEMLPPGGYEVDVSGVKEREGRWEVTASLGRD